MSDEPAGIQDHLYRELAVAQPGDQERGGPLKHLLHAMGAALAPRLHSLVRDTVDRLGWTDLLSPSRAPWWALPWLAQFARVRQISGLSEAEQRDRIASPAAFERGTKSAMVAAVAATMPAQDPSRVLVLENVDDDPYKLTVVVHEGDLPIDAGSPVNLVPNPSFERGIYGWTADLNGTALTSSAFDTTDWWAAYGTKSGHVAVSSIPAGSQVTAATGMLPVRDDTDYTLRAQCNFILSNNIDQIGVHVAWWDADGTNLADHDVLLADTGTGFTGAKSAAGLVTPPAGATHATVFYRAYAQTGVPLADLEVMLDGVMLAPSSTLASYGDGDTSGWTWEGIPHQSPSFQPDLAPVETAAKSQKPVAMLLTVLATDHTPIDALDGSIDALTGTIDNL